VTTDLDKVAEAARALVIAYDEGQHDLGPSVVHLLWVIDGQPEDRIVLTPDRRKRLIEVLRAAGAHPSGLGSYEAAADALSLAEDLEAQR
jgi:hypothetical protein